MPHTEEGETEVQGRWREEASRPRMRQSWKCPVLLGVGPLGTTTWELSMSRETKPMGLGHQSLSFPGDAGVPKETQGRRLRCRAALWLEFGSGHWREEEGEE